MAPTYNIHEAKTHLSRLVDQAVQGREFIIAKSGKPLVRVVALAQAPAKRTLGFLAGKGVVPLDIKAPFADEIAAMFGDTLDTGATNKAKPKRKSVARR